MNKVDIVATHHHPQHMGLGALFAIISAFSFAVMSVFVKKIGTDLPTSIPIFFRFATSFILLLPWVIRSTSFQFKVYNPWRYGTRILSALLALFLMFYALKFIPLVNALLLNNTAPLFVPIIAYFLTGAKTPHKAAFGILIGFIGIALILRPNHQIFSIASCIALVSGILAALAIVEMRIVSKTSSVIQMLFYYFLVSTVVSGIVATCQWQTPTAQIWLWLLGIGVFGTIYQVFTTLAYVTAPVRLMSPLMFFIVIFGGLFDWLLWDYVPDALTISGAIAIIVGSMMTIYFGKNLVKKC
jgi:drug/metabolite transporter (DMT)-like permease